MKSEPSGRTPGGPGARRPARPLEGASLLLGKRVVAAQILVLACFAATLAYVYGALAPVSTRTDAVILNALPSAKHLSGARTALVDLGVAVEAAVLSQGRLDTAADEVEAARSRLDRAVVAELATPDFPGEGEVAREMLGALAALDARTSEFLAVRAAASVDARLARYQDWLAAASIADRAIAGLQTFNLDHGERETRTIMGIQRRAEAIATAMFFGTMLAALVAAAMLVRLMRLQSQDAALHERFLRARADELEAFAGRVAHDLRDPLGALSMRLGTIRARLPGAAPELSCSADKAVQQVHKMNDLLGALLEFARSGASPARGARAELREVVAHVVEQFGPAAGSACAELSVDAFSPEEVACTPGALTSVLSNLVGNAVKYVADGKDPARRIRVHVEDQRRTVRVEVEDNGPGLPPGMEQAVFEPFVRLAPTTRPGVGLGLATVRRIVEAYGGRVGVRSAPGEGSCFWFEMPKASGDA